ncbi:uncharacterized protein LOC135503206 [Lineus longissimus]|uniref:uncharacterized protein LOC135503206 n=1 Tax=Lineus longissimus TaxID=88925 RepID=UPI002B4C95CC
MKIAMLLLLAGLSACSAVPAGGKTKSSLTDSVNSLYDLAKDLQAWGRAVIDSSNSGLDTEEIKKLSTKKEELSSLFVEVAKAIGEAVKQPGGKVPSGFGNDVAAKVTEALKKHVTTLNIGNDHKLGLLSGDPLVADDLRLALNLELFSKVLASLDKTVTQIKALLDAGVTEEKLFEVLSQLTIDYSALSVVYDDVVGSFEDVANLLNPADQKSQKRFRRWLSYNLGHGWSIGSSGINWRGRNRYGSYHFNARPTFNGFRPNGFRAGFTWRF